MKVRELETRIKKGSTPAAVLLVGTEEHFKRSLIHKIKAALFPDEGEAELGTVTFECGRKEADRVSCARVFEELRTLPMLTVHKLVVLRSGERLLEDELDTVVSELGAFLGDSQRTGTLVVHTRGSLARAKKKLEAVGITAVECNKLFDTKVSWKRGGGAVSEVAEWLGAEAKTLGHTLVPVDAERMVEHYGGDLGKLRLELDKLSVLAGAGKPIDARMIAENSGRTSERTRASFHLTDAVVSRDGHKALKMLQTMFTEGLDMGSGPRVIQASGIALILLSALFKRFHILYEGVRLVSMGRSPTDAADELGLKGYPAKKFANEATRHRLSDLETVIPLFRIAERDLKGGSVLPPQTILERLIVLLTQGKTLPSAVLPKRDSAWR